ncbi:sec-independent protein translocase protein TatA [Croceifilum oryzae]|uniref:Sec-independent protein translocase protein TatA n=1 Tax=Croceifilum oryzae TaxID=1553429 RepID=A0AAJ1TE32_9BACL|nr:twin-arginine translocase TatA/TatE family subunit [Croceifilum oryzae]MDQ0417138.1 sec-independent protein translocase protein TatA [Croceifilum oryzae]
MIKPLGILILIVVALLLWGPKKIPELGKAAGETIKNFRRSLNGSDKDDNESNKTHS